MATYVRIEEQNNPSMNVIFPITPSEVPEQGSTDARQFRVIGKGNYSFPDGRNEQKFSVQGYFPGVRRVNARWDQGENPVTSAVLPHINVDEWRPPQFLVIRIKNWMDMKTRLRWVADTLTGTLNVPVYLSSYTFTRRGGMGDIGYQLEFTEWRTIRVVVDDGTPSSSSGNSTDTSAGAGEDEQEEPLPSTYTVKPGDSLSMISKQFLGDAGRWNEIYEANRDTIGDDPNNIEPGMELVIPGGTLAQPDEDGYAPMGEEATEGTDQP